MKPFLCAWKPFKHWFGLTAFFVLFLGRASNSLAQAGLIFEDRTFEQIKPVAIDLAKHGVLPKANSLRKYCPFPKSQGNVSSCVGWAVGYGAMTILRARKNNITDRVIITDQLAFSASYIYNQIKKSVECNSGASLTDALNLLVDKGNCPVDIFPNSRTNCHMLPTEQEQKKAAPYRIGSFSFKLFDRRTKKADKIKFTKIQLAKNNPVVAGFSLTPDYNSLAGQRYWKAEGSAGGHAMTVIGYDDDLAAFELMNSFGSRWGQNGFIWIEYDDFAEFARQAVILEQYSDKGWTEEALSDSLPVQIAGGLRLQVIARDAQNKKNLMEARPVFNERHNQYELERKDWKRDEDLFRIEVNLPRGRCAYLFNVDGRGKAESVWATEAQDRDTIIVLPERGFYQFSLRGEEKFGLIFSYEPIEDYAKKVRALSGLPPDQSLARRARLEFEENLISPKAVQYKKNEIQLEAQTTLGKGIAAPLFFSIHIN